MQAEELKPVKILARRIQRALVGIQFDEAIDTKLLEYLGTFSNLITVENMTLLHVVPRYDVPGKIEEELVMRHKPVNRQEMKEKLLYCAKLYLGGKISKTLKVQIREGNPLEELLDAAEGLNSGLVVIGQKTGSGHHGITAKNFVRQVWSNALLVPEQAQTSLTNILIPVDFSVNSAEALHEAMSLNAALAKKASITLLHTCEMPANFSTYRFNGTKVQQLILEERQMAMQQFVKEHLPKSLRETIKLEVTTHRKQGVARHLVTYAKHHHHDLIVMGVKGHSKAALLLMGSVTEKLLSLVTETAVLIVK
ncbi:MAG: universal stress protein [Saprospiraceae bacterium]